MAAIVNPMFNLNRINHFFLKI